MRCCRWHLCQTIQEEVGLVAVTVTRVRSGMRRFKMAYGRCLIKFSSLRLLIWTFTKVQEIEIKFKPLYLKGKFNFIKRKSIVMGRQYSIMQLRIRTLCVQMSVFIPMNHITQGEFAILCIYFFICKAEKIGFVS